MCAELVLMKTFLASVAVIVNRVSVFEYFVLVYSDSPFNLPLENHFCVSRQVSGVVPNILPTKPISQDGFV